MNEDNITQFLIEAVEEAIKAEIEKRKPVFLFLKGPSISEVCEIESELIRECYMALFHSGEIGGRLVESELKYYLSCLNGENEFSNTIRNELIRAEKKN